MTRTTWTAYSAGAGYTRTGRMGPGGRERCVPQRGHLTMQKCGRSMFLVLALIASTLDSATAEDSLRDAAGEPGPIEDVRVAVLGTPHLSGAPEAFESEMLNPILDRLERFEPDLILVESPNSEHLRFLLREADDYPGLADQFGADALALSRLAGASVSLTPAQASRRAASITDDSRESLLEAAALSARAGDAASAVAHWCRLPAEARKPAGPVNPKLAEALDHLAADRNESYAIGSALGARLDHGAVLGFDDWRAGDLFLDAIPDLQIAMDTDPALESVIKSEVLATVNARAAAMTSAPKVLESYRFFNAADRQSPRARAEWDAFLAVRSHPDAARARLAAWEARNLRMAANIIEAAGGRPGERVLVIVGASHKPYLEDALLGVAGLQVVAAESLLAMP